MSEKKLPLGSTLGILGGGQLGKMLAEAANRLGFKTHVFAPEKESVAFSVSTFHTCADYRDLKALQAFADKVDVITFEFENIPVEALEKISGSFRPEPKVLHICQNRRREKAFLKTAGFPVAPYADMDSVSDLENVSDGLFPGILKTAGFGYDGKGQSSVRNKEEAKAILLKSDGQPLVLEKRIEFSAEVSVIIARDIEGKTAHWGLFENRHKNHILDTTLWPSELPDSVQSEAIQIATAIAEKLAVVGLIAVEFFVDKSQKILVNELAPRPHNSGHITMNASETSQFEQHVRAITGMGLGPTARIKPGVMLNLMGDLWKNGEPKWEQIKKIPGCHLHLYGKKEARPGRKMGHVNVTGANLETAIKISLSLRA